MCYTHTHTDTKMFDSITTIYICTSIISALVYLTSLAIHSVRSDLHYKYLNIQVEERALLRWRHIFNACKLCINGYILYAFIKLCMMPEGYLVRYADHLRHPGGIGEYEIQHIMMVWWLSCVMDILSQTMINFYSCTREGFPSSTVERLVPLLSLIERTVMVWVLDSPHCVPRSAFTAIGAILGVFLVDSFPVVKLKGKLLWWCRMAGSTLAIAHSIGMVVTLDQVMQQPLNKDVPIRIISLNNDPSIINYAALQCVIAILTILLYVIGIYSPTPPIPHPKSS